MKRIESHLRGALLAANQWAVIESLALLRSTLLACSPWAAENFLLLLNVRSVFMSQKIRINCDPSLKGPQDPRIQVEEPTSQVTYSSPSCAFFFKCYLSLSHFTVMWENELSMVGYLMEFNHTFNRSSRSWKKRYFCVCNSVLKITRLPLFPWNIPGTTKKPFNY